MIISHKHKFIFLKPSKVGGTSVEIVLARYCGEKDVVTPITDYNPSVDSHFYSHNARNYEKDGFYNHMSPKEIKEIIGDEIWDSYFKFTIVRNPWDQVVSRFLWERKRRYLYFKDKKLFSFTNLFNVRIYYNSIYKLGQIFINKIYPNTYEFERFVDSFKFKWINTNYYFFNDGSVTCDYYIRFENLENDFSMVCNLLGLLSEKLPKTKDKNRNINKHYSSYYTEESKRKIGILFTKEIHFFDYEFETV